MSGSRQVTNHTAVEGEVVNLTLPAGATLNLAADEGAVVNAAERGVTYSPIGCWRPVEDEKGRETTPEIVYARPTVPGERDYTDTVEVRSEAAMTDHECADCGCPEGSHDSDSGACRTCRDCRRNDV